MPNVPTACQPIESEIKKLQAEIQELRTEQGGLNPSRDRNLSRRLAATIGQKLSQLFLKQQQLQNCILTNGGYVCIPTATVFDCNYVLATDYMTPQPNSQSIGPFLGHTSINILFPCPRTVVFITNFPPIKTQDFSIGIGTNSTTVSMITSGTGQYDQNSGSISIPVSLFFDQRINLPIIEEDSTLDVTFTTGSIQSSISGNLTGSPMDKTNGMIQLVGAGTFKKGWLNGSHCDITLTGTIMAVPK